MKKILIIGGAGFIGSNCVYYFSKKGYDVTIFDNFSRQGSLKNISWLKKKFPDIKIVEGNIINDFELLKSIIKQVEIVIHLAAQVAVTTSVIDPRSDFENNALGTFNVLEAIRSCTKPPILLFSSTNKVYGSLEHMTLKENSKRYDFKDVGFIGINEKENLDFHSPYGCSKGSADQYVRDYARIYNLKTIVFRQSCIYGYRQFGVEDQGWVAWFLIALEMNKPITIYGNGKQVRDILFIEDLCRAYDLALKNIKITSGQVYNLGGGIDNSISLIEFMDLLENNRGSAVNFATSPERPGDQKIFISDNSKALKDFLWKPMISKEDGILKLSNWIKENRNLFF